MRFGLPSALKQPKTLTKMEDFENGLESGVFLNTHRFENDLFLVWTGETDR